MLKRLQLVLFLFLLTGQAAFSTHTISGEIYWNHVGNRVFDVYVVHYHDCAGVNFTWVPLIVQGTSGSVNRNVTATSTSSEDYFSPTCTPSNPCVAQSYLRLTKNTGRYRVDLSSDTSCAYTFYTEDCCRMSYLTQITPGVNSTRILATMRLCGVDSSEWSSPRFVAPPHVNASDEGLRQISFLVNSSAGNDSVFYELVPPLNGASPQTYISGYSYTQPLTYAGYPQSSNGFALDPGKGQLVFTPTTANQSSAYAVRASTYKNKGQGWVLASQVTRDVIVHVQNAALNHFPYFKNPPSEIRICDSTNNYVDLVVLDSNQTDTLSLRVFGDIPNYQIENKGQTGRERRYRLWFNLGATQWRTRPYNFVVEVRDNHCISVAMGGAQVSMSLYATIDTSIFAATTIAVERTCNKVLFDINQLPTGVPAYWVLGSDTIQPNSFSHSIQQPGNTPVQLVLRYSSCTAVLKDTLRVDSIYHFQSKLTGMPAASCEGQEVKVKWITSGGLGNGRFLFDSVWQTSPDYVLFMQDTVYEFSVRDSSGCRVDTMLSPVVASALHAIRDSVVEVCAGNIEPFFLYATPMGGVSPYAVTWQSAVQNDSLVLQGNTTGTFRFTVTDSVGCMHSDSVEVRQRPSPVYHLTGADTHCYKDTFHLTVQHSLHTASTFFDWGQGFVGSANFKLSPQGDSTLFFHIRDSLNCTLSDSARLAYHGSRPFSLPPDAFLCQYDTLRLGWNETWEPDSFLWTSKLGHSADSFFHLIYLNPLTDTIELRAWDKTGCLYHDRMKIDAGKRPDIEFLIRDTKWCENDPDFLLVDSVVQTGGRWLINQVPDSLVSPSALMAGDHLLTYEFDSAGCASVNHQWVRIRQLPTVQPTVTNAQGQAPLQTQFSVSVLADTAYRLLWDFGNPSDFTDTSSQLFTGYTYANKGFYSPAIGVATDYCHYYTILDSAVEVLSGVGWAEQDRNFRIYPNPGKGLYTIENSTAAIYDLKLYDALGREIQFPEMEYGRSFQLDFRHLPAGTYLLKWRDEQKNRGSYIIIHHP